jgi:hypothetical protein
MKMLFLSTAACLVLSLSSSAQAQGKKSSMINFAFRTAKITAQLQEKMASLVRSNAFRDACRCVTSWAISGFQGVISVFATRKPIR